MTEKPSISWRMIFLQGLVGGGVSLLLCLVGIVGAFSGKYLIYGLISMAHVLLLAPIALFAYITARKQEALSPINRIMSGVGTGLVGGAVLALVLLIGQMINVRAMFINASPDLYNLIALGLPLPLGAISPLIIGAVLGAIASALLLLPLRVRNAVATTIPWLILIGLLRDMIVTVVTRWGPVAFLFEWIFAVSGLTLVGAIFLCALIGGVLYWRSGRPAAPPVKRLPAQQKTRRLLTLAGVAVLLLFLPQILGIFFSEILDNVGIYIIMGLGLNIVIGYAGLFDLGYVAFYAIGAYTLGVLTSPELNANPLTFWQALPFAMGMAVLAGILLGLPVLRMRGDYLAIVTLGFGEIIRLLVLSDWLRPRLGGAQGIQSIAQPKIGAYVLSNQQQLYYLILVAIGVLAFIAWRLKDSHAGRSWMAVREDEDVAQAMGINLVFTKLTAFATGALFSGLAGAIFASKLTAAYPHSFNMLVSINVVCLIIVGGMGSIPGVVVGSLALMGLPDLLREFSEFRYWVYGAMLVAMMLYKPEGLWPEERRKLELHEAKDEIEPPAEDISAAMGATD